MKTMPSLLLDMELMTLTVTTGLWRTPGPNGGATTATSRSSVATTSVALARSVFGARPLLLELTPLTTPLRRRRKKLTTEPLVIYLTSSGVASPEPTSFVSGLADKPTSPMSPAPTLSALQGWQSTMPASTSVDQPLAVKCIVDKPANLWIRFEPSNIYCQLKLT